MTRSFPVVGLAICICLCACGEHKPSAGVQPAIASLETLTIKNLRKRQYGSTIETISERRLADNSPFMVTYNSDGLRVYARVDLPTSVALDSGYPIVVFVHGWAGIDAAPELDFYQGDNSNYGKMIEAYVKAGFVVFTPGFRGHGTVNGVPADGIEYMRAWDNGSYLSPAFYAIDVLNLIDGLDTFDAAELDLTRINIVSHSQGGDVTLIALAVSGEGSSVDNEIHAASIWSGTFPSRFTQLETFGPMQVSPQAFMSGDGTWNGTAVGASGKVNENFVFGYPPDWIVTTDRDKWTWQSESWSEENVPDVLRKKLDEMYSAVNTYVSDIDDAAYELEVDENGAYDITHDPRVYEAMNSIGGFHSEEFLTEGLVLQYSDRDFYSLPAWNVDLCSRTNDAGGKCYDFEYAENNHSLGVSEYDWFSSDQARAGFEYAIQRDIALFRTQDPRAIPFP